MQTGLKSPANDERKVYTFLKLKENKFYIIYFAAVTLMACFFPPSGDDFGWATSQGYEVFQNGFADYNGRYLGNLCALAFTRIPYILPLIKGFTMAGILYLFEKLCGNKDKTFRLLAAAMLLIPSGLFIQGFVWTAGFTNYTFSLLVIMLCLWLLKCTGDARKGKKTLLCMAIIVLGVSGQLFMETYTVATTLLALSFIVYFFLLKKLLSIPCLIYALSCIAGAGIMFSNGVYAKAFAGADTYQKIPQTDSLFGLLKTVVTGFLGDVSVSVLVSCIPAIIAMILLGIIMIGQDKENHLVKKLFFLFILLTPLSVFIMEAVTKSNGSAEAVQLCAGIMLLLLLAACATPIAAFESPQSLRKTGVYLLLIIVLTAPLCVAKPIGPRCFAGTYILLLMIIKEMASTVRGFAPKKKPKEKAAAIFLAALIVFDIACYSTVYFSNLQSIDYIRSQIEIGARVIEVKHTKLYFMVYWLNNNNTDEKHHERYCEYYGFPKDIEINYID